jgi:hypothetical protein
MSKPERSVGVDLHLHLQRHDAIEQLAAEIVIRRRVRARRRFPTTISTALHNYNVSHGCGVSHSLFNRPRGIGGGVSVISTLPSAPLAFFPVALIRRHPEERWLPTDITRTIEDLPCWRCTDPRGADLRHALAQTGGIIDEAQCSPISRLPLGCCRITTTAIVGGG